MLKSKTWKLSLKSPLFSSSIVNNKILAIHRCYLNPSTFLHPLWGYIQNRPSSHDGFTPFPFLYHYFCCSLLWRWDCRRVATNTCHHLKKLHPFQWKQLYFYRKALIISPWRPTQNFPLKSTPGESVYVSQKTQQSEKTLLEWVLWIFRIHPARPCPTLRIKRAFLF